MARVRRIEHKSERREHPRAAVQWKTAVGHADQRDLVPGKVRDVSVGGVCMRAPLSAVPGDELLVLLSLKERTLPALATVIRSENLSKDEIELHLRFDVLPGPSRERLERYFRTDPSGPANIGDAGDTEPEAIAD